MIGYFATRYPERQDEPMTEIDRIANEIESGNLRVTTRNNRNIGHPDDRERMVRSASVAAASHPYASSLELEEELIRRGWEPRDAQRISGWFAGKRSTLGAGI